MSGVNTYQSVEVGQATSVDCFRNIVNKTSKNPREVWCFRQFFWGSKHLLSRWPWMSRDSEPVEVGSK